MCAISYVLCRVPGENAALSPLRHALLCAQWCAHEMSQFDWAPLVGLMHSLGRLLSHERCASHLHHPQPLICLTNPI